MTQHRIGRLGAVVAAVVPIGHFDSAQTDSVTVAGPTGPTETLDRTDLTYSHLGPAHFGIAISPEYPDGRRVIWSNGGGRVRIGDRLSGC